MKQRTLLKRIAAICLLVTVGASLSGCIVEPLGGPGWCYYHPYRCR